MTFKHLSVLSKEKDEFSSLFWGFGQLVKHHLLRAGRNMSFPTWLSLTNVSSSPFCPTGDTVCGCHQLRCADFHSKATAVKNFSPFRSGIVYCGCYCGEHRHFEGFWSKKYLYSLVPATRLKLCLQLETALSKKFIETTGKIIQSFWSVFANMSACQIVILWFWFTLGSIW